MHWEDGTTSSVSTAVGGWRAARTFPRWEVLAPIVRSARPDLDRARRRLSQAFTIADLREQARRRVPRAVFDYTDGAANEEISLARARQAYARVEFRPQAMRDVSEIDTSATLLGQRCELPLVFAPTGFTRMMHHEGEIAVARVAREVGIPYVLSTVGTTSIEELANAVPTANKWFQLYVWREREQSLELVRRAADAGYEALVLTVDTPIAGARLRDLRNGMLIPPALTLATVLEGARRPAWWMNYLTTPPLKFATLQSWKGTSEDFGQRFLDPSMDQDAVRWLREVWPGKLVVKGIQTAEDAALAADLGADAIVVSNHGGRQLDRAPVPLEELPAVVAKVGDRVEVYVDSGILSGADVVAALCMGARGALVGRAYLYGLMVGGEAGVRRAAAILSNEIRHTFQLLGVTSPGQLSTEHVRLRAH